VLKTDLDLSLIKHFVAIAPQCGNGTQIKNVGDKIILTPASRLVVLESGLGLESGLKSIFAGLGLGLGL